MSTEKSKTRESAGAYIILIIVTFLAISGVIGLVYVRYTGDIREKTAEWARRETDQAGALLVEELNHVARDFRLMETWLARRRDAGASLPDRSAFIQEFLSINPYFLGIYSPASADQPTDAPTIDFIRSDSNRENTIRGSLLIPTPIRIGPDADETILAYNISGLFSRIAGTCSGWDRMWLMKGGGLWLRLSSTSGFGVTFPVLFGRESGAPQEPASFEEDQLPKLDSGENFEQRFPRQAELLNSGEYGQVFMEGTLYTFRRIPISLFQLPNSPHASSTALRSDWGLAMRIPAAYFATRTLGIRVFLFFTWLAILAATVFIFLYIRKNRRLLRSGVAPAVSEESYQSLFDKTRNAIIIACGGRVLYSNAPGKSLFGFTGAPSEPLTLPELFHSDERPRWLNFYSSLEKNREMSSIAEFRLADPNSPENVGAERWIEAHAAAINWKGIPSVILFLLDITRRKRDEQELQQANALLKELAIRDSLTQAYNRRHMTDIVKQEFERSRRYHHELSCILFDLDYFKEVNDTLGHMFGDQVLKNFAEFLKERIRYPDYIFRYGGEEFLVLLPNTDHDGALKAAEKIRSGWESYSISSEHSTISLTVSAGVASRTHNRPTDWQALITFADRALYQAKAEGRNRISIYHKEPGRAAPGNPQRDISHLKERLSVILDKTKRSSIESIELLVRDMGGAKYRKHAQQVNQILELLSARLYLPPDVIETFKRASAIHNCFKVLLEKTVEKERNLTPDEWEEIEAHPYVLAELTELFDFFINERAVLLSHHEYYDGTGYPEGLKGEEIPLGARIFAIADAIVAMMSDRPHRPKLPPEKLLNELVSHAGNQFDPTIVSICLNIINETQIIPISPEAIREARKKLVEQQESRHTHEKQKK